MLSFFDLSLSLFDPLHRHWYRSSKFSGLTDHIVEVHAKIPGFGLAGRGVPKVQSPRREEGRILGTIDDG